MGMATGASQREVESRLAGFGKIEKAGEKAAPSEETVLAQLRAAKAGMTKTFELSDLGKKYQDNAAYFLKLIAEYGGSAPINLNKARLTTNSPNQFTLSDGKNSVSFLFSGNEIQYSVNDGPKKTLSKKTVQA